MIPNDSTRANVDATQRLSMDKLASGRKLNQACAERDDSHLQAGN